MKATYIPCIPAIWNCKRGSIAEPGGKKGEPRESPPSPGGAGVGGWTGIGPAIDVRGKPGEKMCGRANSDNCLRAGVESAAGKFRGVCLSYGFM